MLFLHINSNSFPLIFRKAYFRNVEDIELWLSELEGQLASEDYGKDLISVQNLQKKLGLLESDYNAHQDRIDVVRKQAKAFHDSGHFDAPMILRKEEALRSRFFNNITVICDCKIYSNVQLLSHCYTISYPYLHSSTYLNEEEI